MNCKSVFSATSGRTRPLSTSSELMSKLAEGGFRYSHEEDLNKLKPIHVDKPQLADPASPVTESDRTQLRTLVGALQWASTQTSPHLQVHTSQIAGNITSAKIQTLLDANKSLRFAKSNNDVALEYVPPGETLFT